MYDTVSGSAFEDWWLWATTWLHGELVRKDRMRFALFRLPSGLYMEIIRSADETCSVRYY